MHWISIQLRKNKNLNKIFLNNFPDDTRVNEEENKSYISKKKKKRKKINNFRTLVIKRSLHPARESSLRRIRKNWIDRK